MLTSPRPPACLPYATDTTRRRCGKAPSAVQNGSGIAVRAVGACDRLQQLISSFRTPCYCYYSSPISLANNTLYVASGDQNVYAYAALPTTAITLTNMTKLPSGAFQFGFTNIAGASFTARTTTDPSLPLASWTALGTVPEISPGRYQMTDLQATQYTRRY